MTNLPPPGEVVWLFHYMFWPSEAYATQIPPRILTFLVPLPLLWFIQALSRGTQAYRAVTTCKCSLFSDGRFSRIMSTCPIYYSLTELYIQYAGSIERKITQICVLSKYISIVYMTLHCSYKNRGRFAGMLIWAVFLWVFLNLEPFTLWVTGPLSTVLLYVYFPADYKTYKASGFSRMKWGHQ